MGLSQVLQHALVSNAMPNKSICKVQRSSTIAILEAAYKIGRK